MNVVIRVDASTEISTGHVMRCLTLASTLRDRGATPVFVSRELPGHLLGLMAERGFRLIRLPAPEGPFRLRSDIAHAAWLAVDECRDAEETRRAVMAIGGADVVVVDHYALDARWHGFLRANGRRIVVIDDLADRDHDADVLIDQNLGAEAEHRYDRHVPPHCVRLLGPRYALLRPEFAGARRALRRRDGALRRVLVFLGGVDAGGYTELAIDALATLDPCPAVDVVLGPTNPRARALGERCRALGFDCVQSAPDMAARMVAADLAIGAGGSTTWERACLGLPSIILIVADNQRSAALAMAQRGCAVSLEGKGATAESIAAAVQAFRQQPMRLLAMEQSNLALVDGLGSQRVASALGL